LADLEFNLGDLASSTLLFFSDDSVALFLRVVIGNGEVAFRLRVVEVCFIFSAELSMNSRSGLAKGDGILFSFPGSDNGGEGEAAVNVLQARLTGVQLFGLKFVSLCNQVSQAPALPDLWCLVHVVDLLKLFHVCQRSE
jgi:hypothetical protein